MEKPFPTYLPVYTITPSELPPFAVRWEEMMGWFIVPRLGERLRWAIYDLPSRKRAEYTTMDVVGRAAVHGVEGVEIVATEYDPLPENILPGQNPVERRFIAQLTDTHCRILAQSAVEDGVKRMYTFLDGDPFTDNWGFGPDNVGNEVNLAPKGDIVRTGDVLTAADKPFLLDIVGRYTVSINGKRYDTVCVIDCYTYVDGVVSEQYLDAEGRTILWRRFNRDDWKCRPGEPLWHERLPGAERLTVNGMLYLAFIAFFGRFLSSAGSRTTLATVGASASIAAISSGLIPLSFMMLRAALMQPWLPMQQGQGLKMSFAASKSSPRPLSTGSGS